MNQHFCAKNIKIYLKNNRKSATLQNLPASKHQFLDDIFIFLSSKNWCLIAGKWLHVRQMIWQSGICLMIYFNILGPKVLVR